MFDSRPYEPSPPAPAPAPAVSTFEAIVEADVSVLDAVALECLGARVARIRAFLDSVDTRIAERATALHASGSGDDAATVLQLAGRLTSGDAKRVVKRSEVLSVMPEMAAGLADGRLTARHADVVARAGLQLAPDQRDQFHALAPELARAATVLPVATFSKHCQRLVDELGDGGLERFEEQCRNTTLEYWINQSTGMYSLRGEFDPETGARIFSALDAHVETLWRAEHPGESVVADLARNNGHLAAHALAQLVRVGNAGSGHGHECRNSAELLVLIDEATLRSGLRRDSVCELGDGTEIPVATARRLACEAGIIPVVLGGESEALDVGRSRRLATHAQRVALRAMHRQCAFPECDVQFSRCQIHHILPWDSGGESELSNLIPLCSRHHHRVHEGRWRIDVDARGLPVFVPPANASLIPARRE